ncbi:MAG: hypothetical protein RLZZ53_2679 [Acidobacteriota bacterium]
MPYRSEAKTRAYADCSSGDVAVSAISSSPTWPASCCKVHNVGGAPEGGPPPAVNGHDHQASASRETCSANATRNGSRRAAYAAAYPATSAS